MTIDTDRASVYQLLNNPAKVAEKRMEWFPLILAGAGVGFAVGLTGVGGGSLMTPLLLLFGFPPHIAVGTDLLYAAITKASGVVAHQRRNTVDWPIVTALAVGSLPASLLTIWLLSALFNHPEEYRPLITSSLGVMLILTSAVLLLRKPLMNWIHSKQNNEDARPHHQTSPVSTALTGFVMGVLVTLSSVGAGAFCAAILLIFYPRLSAVRIVGTDLAHAVPLTLIAGLGHLFLGNVDYQLLMALLIGSLPAIHVGTYCARRIPDQWLRPLLASVLLGLGLKYALF